MILYEWVYDRGKIAEGLFCSEKCAENTYFDNPRTCYKGGPSPLDEQESEELAADWKVCYGCGKPLIEAETKHTPDEWDREYVVQIKEKLNAGKSGTDVPIIGTLIRIIDRLEAEKAELVVTCRMSLTRLRDANWPRTTAGENLDKIVIEKLRTALASESRLSEDKEPESEDIPQKGK